MSKLAFTLIELIIVILIIGIVSALVIKLPSVASPQPKIVDLRNYLYPNGKFYLFANGEEIAVKDKNISSNISFFAPEVYRYDGREFKQVEFDDMDNKKVVFKYSVKNGIGDSFILKSGDFYYLFKPFFIKKFNSFEEAKNEFLLTKYMPKEGDYY